MSWDDYAKTATKSEGGEWPEVVDDLYDAVIQDVSEPETRPDSFNDGAEKTDFYINWELDTDNAPTLRQYIVLPPAYLSDGFLNEKSNLYKTMVALGFDLDGKFTVNPSEWQGMKARVMVENRANAKGDIRPRITAVKPARSTVKRGPVAAAPKTRTAAVAAPAGKPAAARDEWGDEE